MNCHICGKPASHKAHYVGMDDHDWEPLCCECWDRDSYASTEGDHDDCELIPSPNFSRGKVA